MKIKLVIGILMLLVFLKGNAQDNVAQFVQKFKTYQSAWPSTKLHLIFNQEKFSPGDTAYFKAYFLNENLSPINDKQLIDLNLVNSGGESKFHSRFYVTNGTGQNQIAIPDEIPEGIYLVTAYSNWMKNFDPAFFFKKEISIVRKNKIVRDEKTQPLIVVEGGHLVRDVSNKIVIQTYHPGSSLMIVDDKGNEIASSTANINGIATIELKPIRNQSYFVQISGEATKTPLPQTEDDGCSILLTPGEKTDPVKMIIASPPASALRAETLAMILSGQEKIYYSTSFVQGSKEFLAIQIPKTDLGEGVIHVSLLGQAGKLLASRDFYNAGEEHVQVSIQMVKPAVQVREKVKMEISLKDIDGNPLQGEFAVNVINAGLFDEEKQNSLRDELTVLSEVRERFQIDRNDMDWLTSLDNNLILFTRPVPWKEILERTTSPRFAFVNSVQKTGKVYHEDTLTVPDKTQIMLYLQKDKWRYQTEVDKGRIKLIMPDIIGEDEFFYIAETIRRKEIDDLKIVWDNEPKINLPQAPPSKEIQSPDTYASFAMKKKLIDHAYSFFTLSKERTQSNSNRDRFDELVEADVTINVQDYTAFPTMEDLVKEVVRSVFHRKGRDKSIVRVILPEPMMGNATGDPVYIIDDVATKNTAFFLSLKPSDILTLKVVKDPKKLQLFGLMGKNGFIMVQTKSGDAREPLNDPLKLVEGINMPTAFKAVDHSKGKELRRPDFRSTIHWQPSVRTDVNGKAVVEFFCSDDIGKLKIRIDGIAVGAKPFSTEHDVEVSSGTGN